MTIVEMRVHMDCPGCERKITKAISKLDGIDNIDIDMNMQKVTVTGWADQEKVLKTVRKTGRAAEFWPYPYMPEYHDYYSHYYGGPADRTYYSAAAYSHPATYSEEKSYDYRKYGYNGYENGYYPQPPSSAILDNQTGAMFSDDNATGCSVM